MKYCFILLSVGLMSALSVQAKTSNLEISTNYVISDETFSGQIKRELDQRILSDTTLNLVETHQNFSLRVSVVAPNLIFANKNRIKVVLRYEGDKRVQINYLLPPSISASLKSAPWRAAKVLAGDIVHLIRIEKGADKPGAVVIAPLMQRMLLERNRIMQVISTQERFPQKMIDRSGYGRRNKEDIKKPGMVPIDPRELPWKGEWVEAPTVEKKGR